MISTRSLHPPQAHLPPSNNLAQNFTAFGLFRHELPHAISNVNPYIGQVHQGEYHLNLSTAFRIWHGSAKDQRWSALVNHMRGGPSDIRSGLGQPQYSINLSPDHKLDFGRTTYSYQTLRETPSLLETTIVRTDSQVVVTAFDYIWELGICSMISYISALLIYIHTRRSPNLNLIHLTLAKVCLQTGKFFDSDLTKSGLESAKLRTPDTQHVTIISGANQNLWYPPFLHWYGMGFKLYRTNIGDILYR